MVTDVRVETDYDDDDCDNECYADGYCKGKRDGYSKGLTTAIQIITDAMAADNFTNARVTEQLQSLLMSLTLKYQEDVL
jgi:flagellar biosynthesis/type III secretory pathway protein FliH